jgi:4-amino-4-deoxy-L-arabinose transferase-like glycosyltransferase
MLRNGIGQGWSPAGLRPCAGLYRWLAKVKVGGFLLLFATLMVYGLEMPYTITDDGGAYILLAQALITGEGYRNIWWAGSPPHTSYPPVHPLLLAPIISLYGMELGALRLWVAGLGILALYAVYRLFRRVVDDRSAFALLVLTGTSYGIWFYAQSPLSEIPYALFSFLGLFFLEEYKRAPSPSGGWLWLAALAIGTAALTRTIGLALLIGGVHISRSRGATKRGRPRRSG